MTKSKQVGVKAAPFASIEEDARLMGMTVRHDGMSRKEAQGIVKEAKEFFLEAVIVPKRETGILRESNGYVPSGNGEHLAYVDALYEVQVTFEGENRVAHFTIENRGQWVAFQMLYLNMDEVQEEKREREESLLRLAARVQERTGMSFEAFFRSLETFVTVGDDALMDSVPSKRY